jgi:GNAT superfamily N-acetyltransferase
MPNPRVRAIEHLQPDHDLSRFCNERHASLDDWLKERALFGEGKSSRTYVVCSIEEPRRVAGYYAISTSQEERSFLPNASLRKNMPDKIPLILLGRLAVDAQFQGAGLGTALLNHAMRNCLAVSRIAGVRGIVASAIDDEAVRFYEQLDFRPSPLGERMMFMKIETVATLYAPP